MAASARLRAEDWRDLIRLVGECRELGDEAHAWRSHFAEQVARRGVGDLCYFGEMSGVEHQQPKDLGLTDWGWHNGFDRDSWLRMLQEFQSDPRAVPTVLIYMGRLRDEDGICLTRRDFLADREWSASADAQVSRAIGTDHSLFCFRSIPGATASHSVLQFHRSIGRRDFSGRDRAFVREAHAALASILGGSLARFTEPSARDLPQRMQPVLACILEGDSGKQIAARLGLSVHTVNEYTGLIYRHFRVRSRPEFLARWFRRKRS